MKNENLVFLENPIEREYVIAYIDLLGTQELLSNEDTEKLFEHIYFSVLTSTRLLPGLAELNMGLMKFKVFSDNILVAYPVERIEDKSAVCAAYQKVQVFLSFFLSTLAHDGILFRGGITVNKLQINDLMVWGSGLSEVVYLEENIAIYPRIIVSEKMLEVFSEYASTISELEQRFNCFKDFDGNVYFDFFEYDDIKAMEAHLPLTKVKLAEKIQREKSGKNRVKILQKYYWFENYLEKVQQKYSSLQKI